MECVALNPTRDQPRISLEGSARYQPSRDYGISLRPGLCVNAAGRGGVLSLNTYGMNADMFGSRLMGSQKRYALQRIEVWS